jgi:hypothetical protein
MSKFQENIHIAIPEPAPSGKFFKKMSIIFKSNQFFSSEEKPKLKRIELINNNLLERYNNMLSERYNEKYFTELYTSKTINITKYIQCVTNTLNKKLMSFKKLLKSVNKITNSDEKFINIIIDIFISSYKSDTSFNEFFKNLEIISNTTNNNLNIIWSIIKCQLKVINNDNMHTIFNYWINLNSVNILQETDEIKYIMFKIGSYVGVSLELVSLKLVSLELVSCDECCGDFETFKQNMNNIQNLYKGLTKLIGKKQLI